MGFLDKLSKGFEAAKAADNGAELADGTELYMSQKLLSFKDKYSIYDAQQQPVYEVVGTVIGFSFNIKTAEGADVARIGKKVISLSPSYEITFANGQKASLKKKIALLKEEFNGTVNGKELKITGDIAAYSFEVFVGGQKIGAVAKKFLTWGDTYAISFTDESWKEIMVALVVTIDNASHSNDD